MRALATATVAPTFDRDCPYIDVDRCSELAEAASPRSKNRSATDARLKPLWIVTIALHHFVDAVRDIGGIRHASPSEFQLPLVIFGHADRRFIPLLLRSLSLDRSVLGHAR